MSIATSIKPVILLYTSAALAFFNNASIVFFFGAPLVITPSALKPIVSQYSYNAPNVSKSNSASVYWLGAWWLVVNNSSTHAARLLVGVLALVHAPLTHVRAQPLSITLIASVSPCVFAFATMRTPILQHLSRLSLSITSAVTKLLALDFSAS